MISWFASNAAWLAALYVAQFLVYALLLRKFEQQVWSGLHLSIWSPLSAGLLVALFTLEETKVFQDASAGFWAYVIATIAIIFGSWFGVVGPYFERNLAEPGKDRDVYKLSPLGDLFFSIPVFNIPFVVMALLFPRSWMTGADFQLNKQAIGDAGDQLRDAQIKISYTTRGMVRLVLLTVPAVVILLWVAFFEDTSSMAKVGLLSVSILLLVGMLWRLSPYGKLLIVIDGGGVQVPNLFNWNPRAISWADIKSIEPTRTDVQVSTHISVSGKKLHKITLLGNDPEATAALLKRHWRQAGGLSN